MKARVLETVDIEYKKKTITLTEGEILTATDRGDFYELRKENGWGTMAPKEACGDIYEIIEE